MGMRNEDPELELGPCSSSRSIWAILARYCYKGRREEEKAGKREEGKERKTRRKGAEVGLL